MRRTRRFLATIALLATTATLGGCGGMSAWDPSDMLNFLDTKKPVPGERKPVFPEGVPGATQGVPREMIRGTPEFEAARSGNVAIGAVETEPTPPAAEPAPRPTKSKNKSGRKTALRPSVEEQPATDTSVDGESIQETAPAAPPPSQRGKKTARRQPVQPAAEQASPPAQQQQGQSGSPFPDPYRR